MIGEKISYRAQKINTKQGNQVVIVYLDPYTSENLFPFKDILKKYGANWDARNRRWYWALSNDPDKRKYQLDKLIKPCIQELNSKQDSGKPAQTSDEEIQALQKLIATIDEVINSKIETNEDFTSADAEAVKRKLLDFKKQLLAATTDEEFRKRFEPILKKVIEGGYIYSILNTLLITIQDPEATYVYSITGWRSKNRYVIKNKNTKTICLWAPIVDKKLSNQVTKEFLTSIGKKSIKELTDDERNQLSQILKQRVPAKGQVLIPSFYDIRFTGVLRGKEDLVSGATSVKMVNTKSGDENGDLKWFDENTPETQESINIYNALIRLIEKMGIKVSFVDSIDGTARGVSKGGYIDVLKNAPKNIGTCNTLIHELAHEIFHHMELQGIDNKWKKFYLGRGNRHVVEQQAELCAWIIMRFLGYDMKTNINYLGNWGINEENAAKVFDQVASAADRIRKLLFDELNMQQNNVETQEVMNESIINESLTGLEVASMLGDDFKALYLKSKQREQAQLEEASNKLNEAFKRICGVNPED